MSFVFRFQKTREIGANVKCKICGCEFKIRNGGRRRCPGCGAIDLWAPLEG